MRYLEIRRHTMRHKPGKHLTQAGVTLARRIGAELGPFDRIITSQKPRAFETALAMGFAVDQQLAALGDTPPYPPDVDWPDSFAQWKNSLVQNQKLERWGQAQAALWREIIEFLPEGGQALIVTHGGIIEVGAVFSQLEADHAQWGASCDYCEGVRLTLDNNQLSVQILRIIN